MQGLTSSSALDSLFGPVGANSLAGVACLNTGLSAANGGNELLRIQLAALLGGSQQHEQSVSFQSAQLLQVRHALAQQQTTQVATPQAKIQKRGEAASWLQLEQDGYTTS